MSHVSFNFAPETHSTWYITAKLSIVHMRLQYVTQKTALIFVLHKFRITRQRILLYQNARQRVVYTNECKIYVYGLNILS